MHTRKPSVLFLLVFVMTSLICQSESRPDSGSIEGETYKSTFFGFTYTFPKGWSRLQQRSQTSIRLAPGAALYTLLFATATPSNGTIGPSDAGVVVLAEDVSHTDIHNAKDAAVKFADLLSHTRPPHRLINAGREVTLGGTPFFRIDYEQQTFSDVKHYFCSVISVQKGFALRFSVIADSKVHMDEICDTTRSIGFEQHE